MLALLTSDSLDLIAIITDRDRKDLPSIPFYSSNVNLSLFVQFFFFFWFSYVFFFHFIQPMPILTEEQVQHVYATFFRSSHVEKKCQSVFFFCSSCIFSACFITFFKRVLLWTRKCVVFDVQIQMIFDSKFNSCLISKNWYTYFSSRTHSLSRMFFFLQTCVCKGTHSVNNRIRIICILVIKLVYKCVSHTTYNFYPYSLSFV